MNRVIGKTGQRKLAARKKHFHLVSGREFADAIKNVSSAVVSQHFKPSDWQLPVGSEAIDTYFLQQCRQHLAEEGGEQDNSRKV
jgi:hypothetical protein